MLSHKQKSYQEKQIVIITITDFNTKMQHFYPLEDSFQTQTNIMEITHLPQHFAAFSDQAELKWGMIPTDL